MSINLNFIHENVIKSGERLNEVRSFMRAETSLFITGISLSGFLLFSKPGMTMIFLIISVMSGSCASYALNNITDKKEDEVNNGRVNSFSVSVHGRHIVAILTAVSLSSALMLPPLSSAIFVLMLSLSMAYSVARLKKIFLVKNIYTGAIISSALMVGSLAAAEFEISMLMYTAFAFMFGVLINLLGDIRGIEGDIANGVKTIPVLFGLKNAKRLAHTISGATSSLIVLMNVTFFTFLVPFSFLVSFFLWRNNMKGARNSMLSSFSFLPFFILFMSIFGGV